MTSPARAAAERYVSLLVARNATALAELFATDAVLDHSAGRHDGRAAIGEFYRQAMLTVDPVITPTSWSEQGDMCVVSIENMVGKHVTNTVEIFTVNAAGLITRLDITV